MTRLIAIAVVLLLPVATARVPADLLALRSHAVNDPPAPIVAGCQMLDAHKLDGRPAEEREVLYWLGNAALREATTATRFADEDCQLQKHDPSSWLGAADSALFVEGPRMQPGSWRGSGVI